jgi:hypothetical protein
VGLHSNNNVKKTDNENAFAFSADVLATLFKCLEFFSKKQFRVGKNFKLRCLWGTPYGVSDLHRWVSYG